MTNKKTDCANLLRELTKVAWNEQQEKTLWNLYNYTHNHKGNKELTGEQKQLANKLYTQLRPKLIQKLELEFNKTFENLSEHLIDGMMKSWKECESHYPLKDIEEATMNQLKSERYKRNKNYNELVASYGAVFMLPKL